MPEAIEIQNNMLRITRCRYRPAVYPWTLTHYSPPDWRLYYNSTEGSFFKAKNVSPRPFRTDRLYIFPKGYTFSIWAEKPFSHFYIHFMLYDMIPSPERYFELPIDTHVQHLINECIEAGQSWENALIRTSLAYAVIGSTLNLLPHDIFRLDRMPDPRIEKICSIIENNLNHKFSNTELAERAGLVRNSFVRLFHEKMGDSPQQYRMRKCIERACYELHYSMRSIDEIAEATGFADRFHFSKAFGKQMGIPPGMYRRVVRNMTGGEEKNSGE